MKKGNLSIKSSLCKQCGYCCFQCAYLGENGCTNPDYAKNTICESFPVMFGDPTKLGYEVDNEERNCGMRWFIVPEKNCKVLNHTFFLEKLKEIIKDINTKREPLEKVFEFDGEYLQVKYSI